MTARRRRRGLDAGLPLTRIAAALLLLCATFSAARAAPLIAYYEASWASLPAGHLVARFDENASDYNDLLDMDTVALPRLLLHFRARIESDGGFDPDGAVRPRHFAIDYDLRKYRDQRVRLAYVARDGTLIAERTPDDTNRKPVLPERYRRDVIDPLAAFAALRQHLLRRGAKRGDRFTLHVFDDVRRFDVAAAVTSVGGRDRLVHVHLDLFAVAGFKEKDDRHAAEEAPRPLDIFFSDDAMLMPTRLEISVAFLPLVIRFDHRCTDVADCHGRK